jgi:hypothetical protein
MGSIISLVFIDEATIIKIFRIIKIGFIHPQEAPGIIKGLIIGIWRFELQIIFGFWDKGKQTGEIGHA